MPEPLSVYLFRIDDRDYGFRVVAIVEATEEKAGVALKARYRCHLEGEKESWRRGGATLVDECYCNAQASASMEFEE